MTPEFKDSASPMAFEYIKYKKIILNIDKKDHEQLKQITIDLLDLCFNQRLTINHINNTWK